MRKRIGIEAQGLFNRKKSSIEITALGLIKRLQQAEAADIDFFVFVRPGPDECLTSSRTVKIVKLQSVTTVFWEQVVLPAAIQKHKIELLHCTSGTAPLDAGVPTILSFREFTSSHWLMSLYRRWIVPRVAKRARTIITFSEAEKAEAAALSGSSVNVIIDEMNGAEQMLELYRKLNQ